ncbi:hypothetical protein [Oceanobacillus profundus]|uniref:hypothetical protein n=1 Tax=Oceanobacillus profundus TaxID=372463 RepID=UPI0026E488C0|nr:hypothetical protein [Oceanobacillus profundus]MDO6451749.1 hypothetical protein [Oceanobacillus profundus]
MDSDAKLKFIQKKLYEKTGMKVDVYRQEGDGVLAVPHGMSLQPENVIYALEDFRFEHNLF